MTKKQLTKLAEQIAANERVIQTSNDPDAVTKAQDTIIFLSSQLDIEDLLLLDEILQKTLKKF